MHLFLYLTMSMGCRSNPPPVEKKQSTRVHVKIGDHSKDQKKPVQITELQAKLKRFVSLEDSIQKELGSAINLIHSSCPTHLEEKVTMAEALTNGKGSCKGLDYQWRAAHLLAKQGKKATDIINTVTVSDAYIAKFDNLRADTLTLAYDPQEKAFELSLTVLTQLNGPTLSLLPMALDSRGISNRLMSHNGKQLPLKQNEIQSAIQGTALPSYISSESLAKNADKAKNAGVRSTPTWFVNGYRIRGLQSGPQIQRLIQLSSLGRIKWD